MADAGARAALATATRSAEHVVWVQEEPRNMGGRGVRARAAAASSWKREFSYAGRQSAASPAVGSQRVHRAELAAFLAAAFDEPAPGE